MGTAQDITERLRTEQELKEAKVAAALRASEERYTFLADTVPQIIWTSRPDGGLDYYNKAWFDYTGLTLEQTQDWGWGAVLHPDDLQPCIDRWTHSFTTGENYEIEYRFKRASDGTFRWHHGRALPLRDEAGQIVQWVGTCTDIDDAKRAGETLQAANDELGRRVLERTSELHAAKEVAETANRAKSDFLANMSHEIRTPMNGLLGMTELVLESELAPEQREYLGMVKSSGHGLLGLINDILDFSKIEAGKLELETLPFTLRDSVTHMLKPFVLRAGQKQLAFVTEFADDVPDNLIGDPLRLRQILTNFVDNAIKFTERGSVTVQVRTESIYQDGQCIHFSVSDTGIGIPAEKQTVVFEAFAQVDGSTTRNYGGTGLGLAIAAQLVGKMSGRSWVESEVGGGTTFHFIVRFGLPTAGQSSEKPAELRAELDRSTANSGAGLRILLAEDNAINRALANGILAKRGHTLTHASNGLEAVEIFDREKFDVVLMDVQMPELDGFDATRRIREMEKSNGGGRTPVIALTAFAMKGDRERCVNAGMDDYISKPIEKEKLLALLARVHTRGRSEEPARPDCPREPRSPEGETTPPIFSREKLLVQLDHDEELMARIVGLFQQNTPRLLRELKSTIAQGNTAGLERAAHALLSSLGPFGASQAYRLAQSLEECGREEKVDEGRAIFHALEIEIARVNNAMEDLVCATV
ncbi:MAG: ATP-binding protein [Verrucomicrobiota bacterium]|nr:ATP-binding protein [Verrucomicrobiota bacterium]